MSGNTWVVLEHWRGEITETSRELLALGRETADALGEPFEVVLLGHDARGLASELGAADKIIYADDPHLAEPTADGYSRALAELVESRKPHCLLVPMTNVSWDWIGLLPATLGVPCLNFCQDLRVDGGKLLARCLLYGGKMEVDVSAGSPVVLGILSGVRQASNGSADRTPPLEEVQLSSLEEPRVKFTRYVEPDATDVDITQKPVLVSVGRGIGSEDNLELAEQVAGTLGGAVAGSRPVIDQGWLPLSRQVGKSGAIVKPKLYLAAGISGAPEHLEGIKNSDLIIAVNTDPDAPIFNVAHYGVVADASEVLEALAESLESRKGS